MSNVFANLKGDKVIWAVAALLAIFSFLPVYSASSNLAYLHGDGSTTGFLIMHFFHLLLGFCLLFAVHKIPYHYFRGISILLLPIVIVLLIFGIFAIWGKKDLGRRVPSAAEWIGYCLAGSAIIGLFIFAATPPPFLINPLKFDSLIYMGPMFFMEISLLRFFASCIKLLLLFPYLP